MTKTIIKTGGIVLLLFLINSVFGQEAFVAAGGESSGTGVISYSIGQIAWSQNNGSSGFEIQGVQQPFEISILSILEDIHKPDLSLSAYPNPSSDYLYLNIYDLNSDNMSYQLLDVRGRQLKVQDIETAITTIPMSQVVPACYFLKVVDNRKVVEIFKIIKK